MKATPDGMKVCSKCRLNREVAWFSKDKSRSDGLQERCKECRRTHQMAKIKLLKETRFVVTKGTKTCTKCKETKDINLFSAFVLCKDGRTSWCYSCLAVKKKEGYWRNPELSRERQRERNYDWYWKSDGRLITSLKAQERKNEVV